ncbi:histidine ammonia-lyase [Rubrobacter xylanophilus DSM 9941]|uniref:Histidine ammonia-lyase n=1 Tax=Rubrobacter xylanophilus (strain DSM 9941 / JCM 11954 / NBRC 16129 / PRD-1) TaxID=266117 RepID=Q1AYH5_RUBXD|nr:aromatic amino acid ammonia-lyase [Rubrobacter xylanophilus]ABG03553.1 histidine ammonia-lyase [Rubrobacter xylanophilus DSM 9941]
MISSHSTVTLDGASLTPKAVARVARESCPVALAPEARERNEIAYRISLDLTKSNTPVYGLNTGVGSLRSIKIPPELQNDYQRRLLRSHAIGAGKPVPDSIVRAMLVVRANQLAAGGAGVHPALLDSLVEVLNKNLVPEIRELGSLGTGDLTSLAEVGLALLGERPFRNGKRNSSTPLGPRDGLMLMSSNAHAIGESALCAVDLNQLTSSLEACAAISFEAARANSKALDERVHAARPYPGQIAAAAHLRALLEGYVPKSFRLQDSYAFRCLPQVQGALRDALSHLASILQIELNSASENALLVDGEALTTGNFHAVQLSSTLDHVRNTASQAASLSAARTSALMSPEITGLNPFLAEEPGPDSGLMALEYTANSAVGELRILAAPAAAHSAAFISHGVENHASLASLSARKTTRAVHLLSVVAATELVTAVRAIRMRGEPPVGRGAREAFEISASILSPDIADRYLTGDLDNAINLVLKGEFLPNISTTQGVEAS